MEPMSRLEVRSVETLKAVEAKINGELAASLDAIRLSSVNLPPLAAHVQRDYQGNKTFVCIFLFCSLPFPHSRLSNQHSPTTKIFSAIQSVCGSSVG